MVFQLSLLPNLCLLWLGHRSIIQIVQPGIPPRKTSRNIPLQTALPIHFLCFFLLPTPHYGNKPPQGARKSISKFLEHTSSHPHSRKTHQYLLMLPAAQLPTSTNSSFVCSPLLLLVLTKKKKSKKILFISRCFSDLGSLKKTSFSKTGSATGKCGKGKLQTWVVMFQAWRMKHFESSFCSRMDMPQVVQNSSHA